MGCIVESDETIYIRKIWDMEWSTVRKGHKAISCGKILEKYDARINLYIENETLNWTRRLNLCPGLWIIILCKKYGQKPKQWVRVKSFWYHKKVIKMLK